MEQANRELKPVLLDFWASWCEPDRKIPGEAVRPHRLRPPLFFFGLLSIFAVAQDAHALRCAAMKLESQGYFAVRSLSSDPRWRNGSIYLFGLDTHGNPLFSGDPYSRWYGVITPELNDYLDGSFGGRDVVSVGDAFGESFLYYSARDPSTGMLQRKVAFVKRVVAYGLPILVGSGYYLDEGP